MLHLERVFSYKILKTGQVSLTSSRLLHIQPTEFIQVQLYTNV